MDLQYHGANCLSFSHKGTVIVVDDDLIQLGLKSVVKPDNVALFTNNHHQDVSARLTLDKPGEYEVADISIIGIAARSHTDEPDQSNATIFKLMPGDVSVVITGHIYPELTDDQLGSIGLVDVLILPVGGHGYTLDPVGALKIIKSLEPKIVIPTHYDDKLLKYPVPQLGLSEAIKELAMEPREAVNKLKLKAAELSDVTQLVILERV